MKPYTDHDVIANGINIHYYRSTPPTPRRSLLLIHGLTDNGMCWVRVADALRDSYDIVMPDTRGHGFSDKPETGYDVDTRAADLAGLIEGLGLVRPVLFGHSLGGQVATAVGALYPQLTGALVLEDPAWLDDRPAGESEPPDHARDWVNGLLKQQALGMDGLVAACRGENPGWHEDELRPWAESKMQMSPTALREILKSMRPGWQGFLARIQCPVLLVTGTPERGVIITPAKFQEAQSLNAHVREANIANAGHSIHRDQFDAYMVAIRSFLSTVL